MSKVMRISVAVSPELYAKIDKLASDYGMARSSLCAYYVGRSVDMEVKTLSMVQNSDFTEKMMMGLLNSGTIPQFTKEDGTIVQRPEDLE